MTRRRLASLALSTILAIGAGSLALAAPPAGGHAPGPSPRPGAQAPAPESNLGGSIATPDYRIETDSTNWNFNTGDFSMPHRVHFLRPGTDAIGDRATGNSKRGTATLYGDVVVHDSGNANEAGDAAYRGNGPATLMCDQLDLDTRAKLYVATGHVHFAQGTRTGTADKATLNRSSGLLHLEGDVHLTDNGSTLTAGTVDYDLNNKNAEIHGKPAVMTQPVNQQPQQPPPTAAPKHTPAPKSNPHKPASPTHKP
jgi:lipopolysaccharide export system protein LptA